MKKIIKSIVGKRFGRLLVIDYAGQDRNRHSIWKCQCDCGSVVNVRRPNLVSGGTISCGCYNKEIVSLPPNDSSINRILHYYQNGASKRNIAFSLSRERFKELIFSDCFYCGQSPSGLFKNYYHSVGVLYNGIDRVDSNKGYVEGNVVPCCSDCNYAKRKMSIKQFVNWIKRISGSSFFLGYKEE